MVVWIVLSCQPDKGSDVLGEAWAVKDKADLEKLEDEENQ